jgi:pimeloyl-ACP methyl ester carboxylesterase
MVLGFSARPWLDDASPRAVSIDDAALRDIRIPVLLVNGSREVADFVPVADRLERLLPKVSRVVVPGGGGFPLWEFPAAVNAAVEAFLDSL